jgi:hypothetical protein
MAYENLLTRTSTTLIGKEATLGTTPPAPPLASFPEKMTRIHVVHDEIAVEPTQAVLDVLDERVRRDEAIDPVLGLELETPVKMTFNLKGIPASAQLDAGDSPAELPQRILFVHHFGTEYADEGGAIDTGASTTSLPLGAGQGANFTRGTWIKVVISGEWEVTMVTAIATDTLTVAPALSGNPANGALVRQMYNYTRKASSIHSHSMTVQRGQAPSTVAQWTANGVHGKLSWQLPEYGELPLCAFEGQAVQWTGPSAQSISIARVDDTMGAPGVWRPEAYLATSITRGTRLVCEGSIGIEGDGPEWEKVSDGGGVQTVAAVVDVAGRPRGPVITVQVPHDVAWQTGFAARTAYKLLLIHKIGTGSDATHYLWDFPAVRLVAPPKPVTVGARLYQELQLHATYDATFTPTSETGDELDRLLSQFRFAFG